MEEVGGRGEGRAMKYGPITHFTDIEAWKLARKLRVAVYIDNQYISKELYDKIWELSMNAIKVLDGYIRYLKKKAAQ